MLFAGGWLMSRWVGIIKYNCALLVVTEPTFYHLVVKYEFVAHIHKVPLIVKFFNDAKMERGHIICKAGQALALVWNHL